MLYSTRSSFVYLASAAGRLPQNSGGTDEERSYHFYTEKINALYFHKVETTAGLGALTVDSAALNLSLITDYEILSADVQFRRSWRPLRQSGSISWGSFLLPSV